MNNLSYIDSPQTIEDYLYVRFSSEYMSEVGIPDPHIRDQWIKNKIQEEKIIMDSLVISALEDRDRLVESGILNTNLSH